MKPVFFSTPAALRAWFEKHHATARELLVDFHKRGTGKPSITWPESVAEALCFGWIDGIRRRIDDHSYSIRFTPRKRGSNWSAVNVRMVAELEAAGKMTPAGRAVFDGRKAAEAEKYSYERKNAAFDEARLNAFRKNRKAWAFFEAQPPGYRRTVTWWVMSAKQDDTRNRRLARLADACAEGKRLL